MAQWLATVLLPAVPPANLYVFALLMGGGHEGYDSSSSSPLASCRSAVSKPSVNQP
jgi:hypothetical protein